MKKEVTSAGVFLLDKNNRVLLFFRGEPFNDISFPKGKRKLGETLKETAIRECKEETGLDVTLIKKIGINSYNYYWEPTQESTEKTVHYFLAKTTGGRLSISKNNQDNIKMAKWVSLEEVKKLVKHKSLKRLLKKVTELIEKD